MNIACLLVGAACAVVGVIIGGYMGFCAGWKHQHSDKCNPEHKICDFHDGGQSPPDSGVERELANLRLAVQGIREAAQLFLHLTTTVIVKVTADAKEPTGPAGL